MTILKNGRVATRLPAKDLERARAFYSEKLGLQAAEEREGGLPYVCAAGEFALFESTGSAAGDHTQMGWEVDHIEATVSELRSRGVVFEEYDLPRSEDGRRHCRDRGPVPEQGQRRARRLVLRQRRQHARDRRTGPLITMETAQIQ